MLPYEIIMKKRNGEELTGEELEFFIKGYVREEIPDYQMSAFLMAIYFKGMTDRETAHLTMVMVHSGDTVDLSSIPGIKVDKHSTGGVGDTTTLILAPLVACTGIPVAKMSGRGLGHTGGTLDKMEAIPGLTVSLNMEEFISQVKNIGVAVIGQTGDLVPADKKIYALRDVTATVDSLPLIASSVMSKKIAAGSDAILLDVKVGNGAFMENIESARALAKIMVKMGGLVNRKVWAMITAMDQPLGSHIGNSLEVKEAVEILRGEHGNSPLCYVATELGAYMTVLGGKAHTPEEGRKIMREILASGKGAEKFRQMIEAQKGDPRIVDNLNFLPQTRIKHELLSDRKGFVTAYDTKMVGKSALLLGAGRVRKSDIIDPAVGFILKKRIGEPVEKGEPLAEIFANDETRLRLACETLLESISIGEETMTPMPLILDIIKEG